MTVSLGYLASHSRNFESLLQTYRQINLAIQSVFLALGTFIMSRVVATVEFDRASFLVALLFVLTLFSNLVMMKFKQVISTRGRDVNWWHTRIVQAEQSLPPEERAFTQFKIDQSRERLSSEQIARLLDKHSRVPDTDITALLNADIDHIRRVINTYILRGMRLVWFFLLLISAVSLFYR